MTVRINFLPKSYQPPKQMGLKDWGVAAAAALILVTGGTVYASTFATAAKTERQVEIDQAKLQGVRALLAEAGDLKVREERVAQAEAELKALGGHRWSGVLITLRDLTPKQVTWTSLSAEGDKIVLQATGHGLVDVAQIFGGLVDHQEVADVSLRYVNEKGIPISIKVEKPIATGDDAAGEATEEAAEARVAEANAELIDLGTYRQMEFELVITLVKPEGRQIPRGA
jgi:hypothetical protein